MAKYRLSYEAKNDLIRIYQYGVAQFGIVQADVYFDAFFACFQTIAECPYSFESVEYIKKGYKRCVCGVDSIYFRVQSNVSEIMAIVGKQDISNIF